MAKSSSEVQVTTCSDHQLTSRLSNNRRPRRTPSSNLWQPGRTTKRVVPRLLAAPSSKRPRLLSLTASRSSHWPTRSPPQRLLPRKRAHNKRIESKIMLPSRVISHLAQLSRQYLQLPLPQKLPLQSTPLKLQKRSRKRLYKKDSRKILHHLSSKERIIIRHNSNTL